MKKTVIFISILIIFLQLHLYGSEYANSSHISFTQQEKLFIKAHPVIYFSDVQWEPFSQTTGDKYSGIFRDYYDEVEKVSGLKFEYVKIGNGLDFSSVLEALKDKKIDLIDGTGKTQDREKYALFAGPFMRVSLGTASSRQNKYSSLKELDYKKTAIAIGSTALEYIKTYHPNINIVLVQSPDEALDALLKKKVDAVIDNQVVLDYSIENKSEVALQASSIDDYEFNLYALVRNDYPLLQAILQKSIEYIREQKDIHIKNKIVENALYYNPQKISLTLAEQYYLKQNRQVTMCVDPDWEPFEIINKKIQHEGIAADLIQLVAKRTGLNIELLPTKTWEETLAFSKAKKCDILSFINKTPQRDEWLIFTDPIFSDPNVLITRNEHAPIQDLNKVKNETIAIPSGTAMFEHFEKDFTNLKIIPVITETDAMNLVSQEEADMTVRSLIIAAYTIRKEGLFNLKIAGVPKGYENHLRIGVLKENHILCNILNKGVGSITEQEKDAIVSQHVNIVIDEGINYKLIKQISFAVLILVFISLVVVLWNRLLRKQVKKELEKNLQITKQLYISKKQAEMGNMIANISHQWREPLSKLSSINLLLMAKLQQSQQVDNNFLQTKTMEIEKTIDFMSQTMQNFLEFYKHSDKYSSFLVAESIHNTISIIETKLLDNNIAVDIREREDLTIEGIKNEWMQIWLNLLNNSIDVLVERKIKDPIISVEVGNGSILFCDNGGGMDQKKKSNGLGIPMCKEILRKYEAYLTFHNKDGGLCVRVVLAT